MFIKDCSQNLSLTIIRHYVQNLHESKILITYNLSIFHKQLPFIMENFTGLSKWECGAGTLLLSQEIKQGSDPVVLPQRALTMLTAIPPGSQPRAPGLQRKTDSLPRARFVQTLCQAVVQSEQGQGSHTIWIRECRKVAAAFEKLFLF